MRVVVDDWGSRMAAGKKKKKKDAYTFQLGKVPFALLMASLFAALALAFTIGYLAGQITAREEQVEQMSAAQGEEKIPWTFYDLREGHAPAPTLPEAPAPGESPRTVPDRSNIGRFTIQVAAIRDETRARELESRLNRKGYSAYTIKTELQDKGIWFRVRVGRFATREEALSTAKKIGADERLETLIVRTPH